VTVQLVVNGVCLDLAPDAFPPEGLRLLDLAEQGRVEIESSCRSASCGTCLVQVREGAAHLSPAGASERDLLSVLADTEDHRLGCQARLLPSGPGRCVLVTAD
jgi:ferredoxin